MKAILFFISGIIVMSLIAFTMPDEYDNEKGMALVERDSGLYVFQRCKPIMEYETLGRIELAAIAWSDSPKASMGKFRRRAKDRYPNAEGIILSWDLSECEVIRFK